MLLGFAASLLLSRALPRPHDLATAIAWWTELIAGVLLVVLLATAACRRFLPLAALLNLSLLFPDQAPSRFAVARQTGSSRHLAAQLRTLREESGGSASPEAERGGRILSLVALLSVHDASTRGHSERVRVYTDMLSEQLRLPDADRDRLRWASMLHDIGKLVVPAEVLNKPGKLDQGEWHTIHQHPLEGARILAPLKPWLGEWVQAAEHHHERWDGTGYPAGLRGEEISMAGRIVAVADAYETMTASRPYRKTMTPVAARQELVAASGTHFDPRVVRAFLEISTGKLWRAVGLEALLAEIPLVAPVVWLAGRSAGWAAPATATAGAVALLVAAGALGPPQPALPRGVPHLGTVATASTPAGGALPSGSGAPLVTSAPAPAAAAGSTTSQVLAANTPNPPSNPPPPPSGTTPPPPVNPPSPLPAGGQHGASAFAPGHGFGPPPGQGGAAPGQLVKSA